MGGGETHIGCLKSRVVLKALCAGGDCIVRILCIGASTQGRVEYFSLVNKLRPYQFTLGLLIVRLEHESPEEIANGSLLGAPVFENDAAVEVGRRSSWIELDRFVVVLEGAIILLV